MRCDQLYFRWAALACLLLATSARGSFTQINPPHQGEDSHQTIFGQIYGGTFVPSGTRGVDFSNGGITAFRLDDEDAQDGDDPTDMRGGGGGDPTDQTWLADFTLATAEAKFATFAQNFGYFPGGSGGSYVQLFALTGDRYNVQGEANLSSLAGQLLRWGRGGQNRVLSSRDADNTDGEDHMVTYQILGPGDGGAVFRWLLFWEDILRGEQFADFDFQDLVVEITAVPEPTISATCGLIALFAQRRRR